MNKKSEIPPGRRPQSKIRNPKSQILNPMKSAIRNPNSEIIRVLLIEDNPGDVRLIKEALDDVREVSFNLECAEQLSTGLEHMAGGGIDVVLLDLLLPDSQGLDTFTKIYAQAPGVPIIVLTGIKDEILAIDAMREGAQDYLVKGQMDNNLLRRSICYAIERKRVEKDLRESQETAYALLNATMSAAFLIDTTGIILAVNEKGAQGFDKSIDEVIGLRITDFLPTEVAEYRKRRGIEATRSGKPVRFEDELEGRCFDINIYPVFNEQRMVNRLAIYARDITERKRSEEALKESEDKFRNLAEQSPNMIFINKKGKVVYANKKCKEIMGYRRDEFYSPDFDYLSLIAPESIELVRSRFAKHINNEEVEPYEYTLITKNGRRIEAILNTKLINYEGERAILGTITDITEHKRAEEARRESEEQFRALFEQAADSIVLVDAETGELVEFNDKAYENLGYTRKEFGKLKIPDFEVIESAEEVAKHIEKIIKEGADSFETKQRRKNGEIRDIQVSTRAISICGRGFVQSIWRDITERKRAEEAVRESEERYRSLVENIDIGVILIDCDYNIVMVNGGLGRQFNKPPHEMIGKKCFREFEKRDAVCSHCPGTRVMATGEPAEVETEGLRDDGGLYNARLQGFPIFGHDGTVTGFIEVVEDITERKLAEEAMERQRQAVERLAEEREIVAKIGRIINSTLEIEKVYEQFAEEVRKVIPLDRIVINIVHPENGTYVTAYIAGLDVEGHKPGDVAPLAGSVTQELIRRRSSLLIQIDDRDDVGGRFPSLLANFQAGFRSFMAVPLISKDRVIGSLHLQSLKSRAYTAADVNLSENIGSQIAGAIANAQLYQDLKRQWAFSTTLIDTMSEGMGVLDEKGRLEFGNRRLFQMLGYSSEESVGMHWTSLVHPDYHSVVRAQGASGKDAQSSTYECQLVRKDGTPVPVLISWAPRLDDQDKYKGNVVIVTDLTERKRTEQRLREYEARYSHLLDHMPDGVALSRRGRIIRVNPTMAQMFGFPSPEKMKGLYVWDIAAPISKEIMRQQSTLSSLGQQGENRFEFQGLRKDGQAFPAEVTLTIDRSEPQPFVLSIIRNITERKNHENQRKLLSDRIMTAQEKERTLIARELHDELGQALTGIKMDMAWIKNHIKGPDEAVSDRFVALAELIDSTIESVQKMATSLRPSILDRLGLAAAIEWQANEFERRTGIECIVESMASDFTINSKTAINAYRIFQEALTNVARHAGASRVDVRMAEDGGKLAICISDDGRGIPSGKLSGPTSLGIAGMRERAGLVNGRLDIQSQREKGTRVTAYLPLSSKGSKI